MYGIRTAHQVVVTEPSWLLAFTMYAVAALLLGATLQYLVGRPCLKLRERRLPPGKSVAAPAVDDLRSVPQSS